MASRRLPYSAMRRLRSGVLVLNRIRYYVNHKYSSRFINDTKLSRTTGVCVDTILILYAYKPFICSTYLVRQGLQSVTSSILCSRPSAIAVVADFPADHSQRAYLKLCVVNWNFDLRVLVLLVFPAQEEGWDQHRVPRFRIRLQSVSIVGTVCTIKG